MSGVPFKDGSDRSLGSELRASRQGFRWAPSIKRYLRISLTNRRDDRYVVEFATPESIRTTKQPRGRQPENMHLCWWEDDEAGREIVLTAMAPLVAAGNEYQRIEIDHEGNPIPEEG